MKCLKCGGMQMLRCQYTGGGIYWLCPRCNSTIESTSNQKKPIDHNFPTFNELIEFDDWGINKETFVK